MEQYPTVSINIISSFPVYVFDKLDGSNIRVEWTLKNGFNKYGSRKVLMDKSHEFLGSAIELFENKYKKSLEDIFKKERWQKVTCFFEYHSPNSFAGFHADELHDVTFIDIHVYKKGYLSPNEFYNIFKSIDIPKLLYNGTVNKTLIDSVNNGTLQGMTFEGVVCKAMQKRKYIMFKIKNKAWLDKLKNKCGNDEKLFNELM
jgi:hypothetical protein